VTRALPRSARRAFALALLLIPFLTGVSAAAPTVTAAEALAREHGFVYRFDPFLRNAFLERGAERFTFHVGSEYAFGPAGLFRLRERVRLEDGKVILPASVVEAFTAAAPAPRPRASAAPVAPASAPAPRTFRRVVVDAGHGGEDTGAISPWGLEEKFVVLDIARHLKSSLEARGLEVVMTRDRDVFVELDRRATFAGRHQADLFVSVHANASTSRTLRGFETYYLAPDADDAGVAARRAQAGAPPSRSGGFAPNASEDLRTVLWDLRASENRRRARRAAELVNDSALRTGLASLRRLKDAGFRVLKWSDCPSILVETGYLTHREDERLLRSPLYRRRLADAVADGILAFKEEVERKDAAS